MTITWRRWWWGFSLKQNTEFSISFVKRSIDTGWGFFFLFYLMRGKIPILVATQCRFMNPVINPSNHTVIQFFLRNPYDYLEVSNDYRKGANSWAAKYADEHPIPLEKKLPKLKLWNIYSQGKLMDFQASLQPCLPQGNLAAMCCRI